MCFFKNKQPNVKGGLMLKMSSFVYKEISPKPECVHASACG